MRTKLAHVCIESEDLEATEAFYRVLGLERRFDFRNKQGALVGYYLAFSNDTFIEVIKVGQLKASGRILHFAMEIDNADATYQRLKANGIDVSEKEWAGDNNWMVTCTDPSGVFIELQEYTQDSLQRVGGVCPVDYQP